jgi:hypothetical protein
VTLSCQNDFDDLFFGDSETINVIVSEAITLPHLRRTGGAATPKTGGVFPTQRDSVALTTSRDMWPPPSRVSTSTSLSQQAPLRTAVGGNRFPQLFEQHDPQMERTNIRWKKGEVLGQVPITY